MTDAAVEALQALASREMALQKVGHVLSQVDVRSKTGTETLYSLSKKRGLIRYKDNADRDPRADTLVGYKLFRPGEIVMNKMQAWNGVFGHAKHQSGIVSPDYVVLRTDPGHDPRFFEYMFRTDLYAGIFKSWSTGVGTGFLRLQWEKLRAVPVPCPPASSQQAIADFLDRETWRIDALVEKKRRLIELLEEKRNALISHVVTKGLDPTVPMRDSGIPWLGEIPAHWDVFSLRRLARIVNSNVDKKIVEGEVPVLLCNYTDVYSGSYLNSTDGFMKGSARPDEVARYQLRRGTVLITKDSESPDDIGVPAFVERDLNAVCGYHLSMLLPNESLVQGEFLYWVLESEPLRASFSVSAKGVTRFGLTKDGMGSVSIPVPDANEQREISSLVRRRVEGIAQAVERIDDQLALLAEYRQALITAAVTGQIDVGAVAREPEEVVA